MDVFNRKLRIYGQYPVRAKSISVLLVQMGYKCDLRCTHCYVDASTDRQEEMSLETVNDILSVLKAYDEIIAIDITGGAPELNPHFKYLAKSATALGRKVIVRSNLTVYSEPGMGGILEFFFFFLIKVFASLPCYTEEGVDRQRGKGTYKKAISALKTLNALGYGLIPSLELDIAVNPPKASLAPDKKALERTYTVKLQEMHGITFNNLVAISNVPVGRLRKSMTEDQYKTYIDELEGKFNPDNVKDLMCRELLCVSYDGRLHDCGYLQIQDVPVKSSYSHINNFDYAALSRRAIANTPVCFICTAGAGIGCECGKIRT